MRKYFSLAAVLAAFMATPAQACLWDSDTIAEERSKFPTAMEILAGKYNKHSPAFYEWRIKDRQKKLAKDPRNPALLDDLGVALCKTGKFKEAVEVGEREVALDPKRYESQSNLGTYYIFAGDLEKSAQHIKAALAINPDAHFGREKYQLYLVEYMMEAKKVKGEAALPLSAGFGGEFGEFVSEHHPEERGLPLTEKTAAMKGILGMMRFANDELPILNEALGDLILYGRMRDGNQIASRAYLKASYHVPTADVQAAYRTMAEHAVHLQTNITLDELEGDFKDELAQGKAWQAQIARDEAKWIAEGKDAEKEFDLKYRADNEPSVWINPFAVARQFLRGWFTGLNAPIGWGLLLGSTAIALYVRSIVKRRKAGTTSEHQSFKLTR